MESLWTWLSTPPGKNEILDLFGVLCLLLFVPGFVVSAYLTGSGAHRLTKDPVQLAGIRYCASIWLWVFGVGLFFFGVRVMQINPLSLGEPKWLIASMTAVIFAAARCIDWWRTEYRAERALSGPDDKIHPLADFGSQVGSASARQSTPDTTSGR